MMNLHKAFQMTAARTRAAAGMAAVLTAAALGAGSLLLTAAAAPVRLLGVSAQDAAVVIEATEPVAYTVSRPDPLTLVVELRGVSVGEAASRVRPPHVVSAVRLEQATGADGVAVVRVRLTLDRAAEYKVASARNAIRLDFAGAAAASPRPAPAAGPAAATGADRAAAPRVVAATSPRPAAAATAIERIRATRNGATTTVTIAADGKLTPSGVTESRDLPRRLTLDFANVATRAAAQTAGDGELVRRVRVQPNSQGPLLTRVVMEMGEGTTYTLQRGTVGTRELAVVFQAARGAEVAVRSSGDGAFAALGAETLALAQANVGPAGGSDAMAALTTLPQATAGASPGAPAVAARPAGQARVSPARSAQDAAPAAAPRQAPPAPVLHANTQQLSSSQDKKYVGHPISMDFQGVDLRSVLRTFAEISGLNMVIDPDVQGTVDIVLTDVPWDQALEVILRGNQLDYTVDGTIVRIAKVDTLKREQDSRVQLAQSAAQAGALAVRTYTLSYAKADQAAPLIRSALLSPRGNVQIDARTNTLIVTDLPDRLDTVNQLLGTIDRAEPQVEIEARIITTTRDFARALGVQWGFNGRVNSEIGNTTPLAFPNNGSLGGRVGGVQGPGTSDVRSNPNDVAGTGVGLGVADATSAVGLALGSINGAFNLDVALSALERSGKGRILSTPRVTTQNNVEAEITQGVQIPVQTVANETVTVTFKDAALTLKVTPQITASNTVIMQITLENASPGALVATGTGNIPSIDTQRAITRVQVSDGMTTVMGGIFVSREITTNDKTPLMHRIPLLGWLFKRDSQVDESRELLIFITPRIQKG